MMRGVNSHDHEDWQSGPVHAAPPSVAAQIDKREARKRFWSFILLVAAILGAGSLAVWAILSLKW